MADQLLDASGLNCPLPILKARKSLQSLASGETLEVISTDPGSVPDFNAFCRTTGHELLEQTSNEGKFRFLIRKHDLQSS